MGQIEVDDVDAAREAQREATVGDGALRLCGRFVNGVDSKSRVVMPSSFRKPFQAVGGLLTPWRGTCLVAMAPADFDAYRLHTARTLVDAHGDQGEDGEDPESVLGTLWSSTVTFTLDLQGRLVLPEEVRNQVGITDEVRFQGRGRRVELWPGLITPDELDQRADHLRTLAAIQSAYIPELEG